MTILLWIAAFALGIAGFAGLVIPGLPGAPLLFLGLAAAAWAEGFAFVDWRTLLLLAVLAALTYVVDVAATALGAQQFGGSKRAVAGAAIGVVAGLFFGLPGILLGPFLGATIAELSHRRHLRDAGIAGIGATLGLLVGTVAKVALAVSMVGVFLLVRFL